MIDIIKNREFLQLIYSYEDFQFSQGDWVISRLKENDSVKISSQIFHLQSDHLYDKKRLEISKQNFIENCPDITFNISELKRVNIEGQINKFYEIFSGLILKDIRILLHKDYEPSINHFKAETNISVFKQISELVEDDIIIGGDLSNSIPLDEFYRLIKNFPNTYQKKLYAQARISSLLRNYFEKVKDSERIYKKYRNKKPSKKLTELKNKFQEYEIDKFQSIYDKLESMLENQNDFNEHSWQAGIIDILLLIFPKYIEVFRESPILIEDSYDKSVDFLFVDAIGHIDVLEIKQPFEHKLMTKNHYRGNYIPLRELSGTVMQVEKYIYHLNRSGEKGEKKLLKKYKDQLPEGFNFKITNPKGLIIMGRENNLSIKQKRDFEVIKRKYKNVVDILSYDDLLNRLKLTIEQIKSC